MIVNNIKARFEVQYENPGIKIDYFSHINYLSAP